MADQYDKNPISSVLSMGARDRISEPASVTVELSRFVMAKASGSSPEGGSVVPAHPGRKVLANIELQPNPDAQALSGQRQSLFVRWVASF